MGEYETIATKLISGLNANKLALAEQIASLPDEVRGFWRAKAAATEIIAASYRGS
jgi:hypothetical protein